MNDTATSTPGADLLPEGIGALTTLHFVLIALVAIAAIAMIVAGIRRSRTRKTALREVAEHAQEAGVPPLAETSEPEPQPNPVRTPEPAPEPTPPPTPARPLPDDTIAAAAPLEASPAVEAATTPVASAVVDVPVTETAPATRLADAPVTQLKGLGPKVATRLGELGITTVGQIAALSDDEAAALDAQLGPFSGRIARDRWTEQARLLAAGDRAGFEAVFGKL